MTPAHRSKYPPNWEELARQCKERAAWQCEHCGSRQYELRASKRGTPYLVYLAACHKYHDKTNPNPELIALCVSCHAKHDHKYKQAMERARLEQLKHLKRLIDAGIIAIEAFYS